MEEYLYLDGSLDEPDEDQPAAPCAYCEAPTETGEYLCHDCNLIQYA